MNVLHFNHEFIAPFAGKRLFLVRISGNLMFPWKLFITSRIVLHDKFYEHDKNGTKAKKNTF